MGVNGIYGLSGSGLDVQSLVKAGMLTKQNEYDKMYKSQTKDAWIKSAYSDFYSSMTTFKYTTLSNYKMQSTMNAMKASSSDTASVTATANGAAVAMSHKVQVNTLSSNAYLLSAQAITRSNTAAQNSIYLKDSVFGKIEAGKTSYTYNGNTYTTKTAVYDTDGTTVKSYTLSGGTDSSGAAVDDAAGLAADAFTTDVSTYNIRSTTGSYTGSQVSISYDGAGSWTGDQLSMNSNGQYVLTDGSGNQTTITDNSKLTIQVNGTSYAANADNLAIGKKSTDSSYTFSTLSAATEVSATDKAISFTVAGTADTLTADQLKKQTISYTFADLANGKTYNDLVSDINATNSNVQASYDAANDAFSLYNKTGGAENTITLTMAAADTTDASGNLVSNGGTYAASLFNHLHLAKSADGALETESATSTTVKEQSFSSGSSTQITGAEGSVTIDGKTYTGIKDNKITVSGVTYSLLNKTTTAATVSVSQDTDSVISSVKQFVTDYNKMLDSLNDKIYETQYSDYQPLTKTQEASMTTDQITKWNEKAKSGLLYHSDILRNIVSSMREAIYTPVESVNSDYNSASAIGITSSTNKGHLTLDEDKLKTALAADPDCVYQIFASEQDNYYYSDDNKKQDYIKQDDYKNTGIANRLYFTSMTDGLKSISSYAGTSEETDDQSSLGKLITNLQTKMSTFKTQMDAYETLLYKRYDAMETAIAQLSKQLSTVTGSNS